VRAQKWEEDKSLLLKDYFGNRGLKNVPSNAWLTMPISPGNVENQCLMLSDDPGIVFRVADRDDKFFGIHVIWLNGDLTGKREAKPHRQCHGPIKGGYIKIGELDPDKPLVVAEGVETAMAVLQITNLPCALVGCGANTADVNLPSHSEYIIAADNDDAGQKTATKLAQRHAGPDCKIRIATPDKPKGGKKGYDWNDALMAGVDPKLMRRAILKAPVFEDVGADEDDADHDKNKKKDKQALALAKLERIPVM